MVSAIVFLLRLIAGLIILCAVWFVLDTIYDRNTEIIVATIGLMYSFIFMISRRLAVFWFDYFFVSGSHDILHKEHTL